MWRINHSDKISADDTKIIKNDYASGGLDGCSNYITDGVTIYINENKYENCIIYTGEDDNKNEYQALRIMGLSKYDADTVVNHELESGNSVAYRVYNTSALSQLDGHTILCTGRNQNVQFTYSNCATSQQEYQTNRTIDDQANNSKYYMRNSNIEIIIDITK